jgi:hypothetical protein
MVRFLKSKRDPLQQKRLQFVEVDKLQDASLTRVSWPTSETNNRESGEH